MTPEFPKPAVTVDVVSLTLRGDDLQVLLIKRDIAPYRGRWAIPGGFVHIDESLENAARRELSAETGVSTLSVCPEITFPFDRVEAS